MQVVTTLVLHEPKNINGRNGTFTIHKFKTADGSWLQTTKTEIANQAYALLNQQVTVDYHDEERGQYTNHEIDSVVLGAVPGSSTSIPKTGGGGGGGGRGGGYRGADQAVINRSAALARAIEAKAAGIVEINGSAELFKVADFFVKYIETAPAGQGGAVSSDGGGADAGAVAPTAAPAAAPTMAPPATPAAVPAAAPAAPASPQDDIPF